MSNILYIVTLNNGNFSLPITQHHQVDVDTLITKSPFEDNEDVVIVPMLEDKLYVYPLKVWQQLKNESSDALQHITGLDNLMIEHPMQKVKNQTIQLNEMHIGHLGKPKRLWFIAHKNYVEVWAIQAVDEKKIAQRKLDHMFNNMHHQHLIDKLERITKTSKKRLSALKVLNNIVESEAVERAITLIALSECARLKITQGDRKNIIHEVIREVFNQRLSIGLRPCPKLSVYSIARNICVRYLGSANAQ